MLYIAGGLGATTVRSGDMASAYPAGGRLRMSGMDEPVTAPAGLFEARYLAFLETIAHVRPALHRYCARMVGSVLDGEDIVQDALFRAYRKLDSFDDSKALGPWLFRIAHNQCIDFLRRRRARRAAEAEAVGPDWIAPVEPHGAAIGRAVEHIVLTLPPKERACLLLKDVFDYSLEEIADMVGSTVGGVKAALKRGRSKLSGPRAPVGNRRVARVDQAMRLRDLYIERFNRKDWDGVRELISADARLVVADRYSGPVEGAPYFGRYDRLIRPWRLASGEVDGEDVLMVLELGADVWVPQAIVRLSVADGQIVSITDYTHCAWVLPASTVVRVDDPTDTHVQSASVSVIRSAGIEDHE